MSDDFPTLTPGTPGHEPGKPPARTGGVRRTGTVAAAVTLLAPATAGCGGGGVSSGGSAGATLGGSAPASASASASTPASASGAPGTSAVAARPSSPAGESTGGQAAPTPSPCTADHLGPSLSAPDPGAGQIYYDLRLVNKGPATCVLRGFPGVSLLAGDGTAIGEPAAREGGRLAVTLTPGGTAHVTLHTLNRGVRGDGCWAEPGLLKIYPPGSR